MSTSITTTVARATLASRAWDTPHCRPGGWRRRHGESLAGEGHIDGTAQRRRFSPPPQN